MLAIVNERSRASHKANIAYYAMSLFKRENVVYYKFPEIYIPPLEEEVDSTASAVEDGGVQNISRIKIYQAPIKTNRLLQNNFEAAY